LTRIGLIGYGAIGRSIVDALAEESSPGVTLTAICVRERQRADATQGAPLGTLVTTSIEELLATKPDLVVEAAGHSAVIEGGTRVLERGCDFCILSTGALAQHDVYEELHAAARRGGSQIVIPPGALAGFDGLLSLRQAGLTEVTYTSTKPPIAWRGTMAEKYCDLDSIVEPFEFLAGSAREIALTFPKNANLAAAVAFAGIGLDRTRVRLVADPRVRSNIGRIEAASRRGRLDVVMESEGSSDNPKTSEITGYSILGVLANRSTELRFQ
jgi:aspartate dehydrogenase